MCPAWIPHGSLASLPASRVPLPALDTILPGIGFLPGRPSAPMARSCSHRRSQGHTQSQARSRYHWCAPAGHAPRSAAAMEAYQRKLQNAQTHTAVISLSLNRVHEQNRRFKIKSVKLLISGANESPRLSIAQARSDCIAQNGTAVAPLRTDYCSFKLWQKFRNWIMQVHNPTFVQDQKADHKEGFPDNTSRTRLIQGSHRGSVTETLKCSGGESAPNRPPCLKSPSRVSLPSLV